MNKDQFIALGLSEEQADKAATASQEELKGFIPKPRFDEVNTAKKAAEDTLKERDKQLEDLKKTSGDSEALKQQIDTLQAENQAAKEKYESEVKELSLNTAVKLALSGKAHDPDIVLGQLDKTKIELDEAGAVKGGLEDQIKALQTSKAFLFIPEDTSSGQWKPSGASPAQGAGGSNGGGQAKGYDAGKSLAEQRNQTQKG